MVTLSYFIIIAIVLLLAGIILSWGRKELPEDLEALVGTWRGRCSFEVSKINPLGDLDVEFEVRPDGERILGRLEYTASGNLVAVEVKGAFKGTWLVLDCQGPHGGSHALRPNADATRLTGRIAHVSKDAPEPVIGRIWLVKAPKPN